jgi:transcriptional regulator
MYIPNANRMDDRAEMVAFMRANSFATLVSLLDGVPVATHLPLIVRAEGEQITLTGHLARANPQWNGFAVVPSLAIFTGPHAYVSPSLYEAHESVPTWNYIAVHAYGAPVIQTASETRATLEASMEEMIAAYEPAYQMQWESLSERFREGMLRGVVGFTIAVTRLEGKAKLSQNRSAMDQHTVAAALLASDDPAARATGVAMREQQKAGER